MKKRKNLTFLACTFVIIVYLLIEKAFVPNTFGKIYKGVRKSFKNEIKRKRSSGLKLKEYSVDIFVNTKKSIKPFSANMPRGQKGETRPGA